MILQTTLGSKLSVMIGVCLYAINICIRKTILNPSLIRLNQQSAHNAIIGKILPLPPILPTARVLIWRAIQALRTDPAYIWLYMLRYGVIGVLVGSIFWHMDDGSYLQRMALFASCFVIISVIMVDLMPGIHKRKSVFLRERYAYISWYCTLI